MARFSLVSLSPTSSAGHHRRLMLLTLVALVIVAGAAGPGAASTQDGSLDSTSNSNSSESDLCESPILGPPMSIDPYRLRCEVTPVEDPRPGASYELSVFVGLICPIGQPDEFCFAKVGPQPVGRTGAHVAEPDALIQYIPGDTVGIPVCIQFVICETVHVPLTFTLKIFDDGAQGELEIFLIGGDPSGVNPPQICTGVEGDCDDTLENDNPGSWVY